MIKYRFLFASLVLVAAISCSSDNPGDDPNKGGQGGGESSVTDVRTVKSALTVDITTDKACYAP